MNDNIMYPVYRCRNCGECIVVKRPTATLRNFKHGLFHNQSKEGFHICNIQPDFGEEYSDYDFHVALDLVGYVKKKEREEVQNEIRDGELNSGDQESNGETDIDKQSGRDQSDDNNAE